MSQRLSVAEPPPPAPARSSVGAFELLQSSEQWWKQDLPASLRGDASAGARRRRSLVFDALLAYDRLRQAQAPHADPLTVFRRWPVCTVVSLVALAATQTDTSMFTATVRRRLSDVDGGSERWLRAWATCWTEVTSGIAPDQIPSPRQVPGLAALLITSGLADPGGTTPAIKLDLGTGSVRVVAPGGSLRDWEVLADGRTCVGVSDERIVSSPAAEIRCHSPLDDTVTIPFTAPDDPLLVFDADGILLTRDSTLPTEDVWLLHPGEPPREAFDGTRRIVEEAVPPPGWAGWWLGKVALKDVHGVRSFIPGQATGPWRRVSDSGAPEFVFEPALEGVLTTDGDPVHVVVPRLILPPGETSWTIEVGTAGAEPRARTIGTGGRALSLAELLPSPALGRFRVTVKTSGRQNVSTVFTVAEGLAVHSSPTVRPFVADGRLIPATVKIMPPQGMSASPRSESLRGTDLYEVVLLATGSATLAVHIKPPHTAVRKRVKNTSGPWHISPLAFTLDELHDSACLDFWIPPALQKIYSDTFGELPVLAVGADPDNPVQRIPGRRFANFVRYDLGKIADTVTAHGSMPVAIKMAEWVSIATVTVPPLARAVVLHKGGLRLIGRRSRGSLRVVVHPVLAPWTKPHVADVPEGASTVSVPAALANGTELLVTVLPGGPSVSSAWKDSAVSSSTALRFRIGDRGLPPDFTDPVRRAAAAYLAGAGPLPETSAALPLIWVCAARAADIFGAGPGGLTAQECASRLGELPEASLFAAAASRLPGRDLVGPMIRSGLAAHRLRLVPQPNRVAAAWAHAPLASLLLSSPLLPYLADSPDFDRAELDTDELAVLDALHAHCDLAALGVLRQPTQAEEWAASLPDPLRPGEAVEPSFPDGKPDPSVLQREMIHYFEKQEYAGLLGILAARDAGTAFSLGAAVIARLAAQGDRQAGEIERRVRPAWVDIAIRAPDLVAADLAVAEFLITAFETHRR